MTIVAAWMGASALAGAGAAMGEKEIADNQAKLAEAAASFRSSGCMAVKAMRA